MQEWITKEYMREEQRHQIVSSIGNTLKKQAFRLLETSQEEEEEVEQTEGEAKVVLSFKQ